MVTFAKSSVMAVGLLLLIAPLVATAQPIVADRSHTSVVELGKSGQSTGSVESLFPLMMAGSKEAATSEPAAKTPPQPGMVWVNTETGTYHREGDRWYGKTKVGKFMTEADAKQAGYREGKR